MSDLIPTILLISFTLVFTALKIIIEIPRATESRIFSCLNLPCFIYLIASFIGNLLTAFLAAYLLSNKLPDNLDILKLSAIHSGIGVLAFEAILSNTTISFFGKNLLSIQELIDKAYEGAFEGTNEKDAEYTQKVEIELTSGLKQLLSLNEVTTELRNNLTQPEFKQLEVDIKASYGQNFNALDELSYKCNELARKFPIKAKMIIKEKQKQKLFAK